jgi:hypothetical protein
VPVEPVVGGQVPPELWGGSSSPGSSYVQPFAESVATRRPRTAILGKGALIVIARP